MQPFSSATCVSGTIPRPDRPRTVPGVLACWPGRGFRGPYRESEISQAEAHYL
jgi:hypothetical protein